MKNNCPKLPNKKNDVRAFIIIVLIIVFSYYITDLGFVKYFFVTMEMKNISNSQYIAWVHVEDRAPLSLIKPLPPGCLDFTVALSKNKEYSIELINQIGEELTTIIDNTLENKFYRKIMESTNSVYIRLEILLPEPYPDWAKEILGENKKYIWSIERF
jgi:hypothetical protein